MVDESANLCQSARANSAATAASNSAEMSLNSGNNNKIVSRKCDLAEGCSLSHSLFLCIMIVVNGDEYGRHTNGQEVGCR